MLLWLLLGYYWFFSLKRLVFSNFYPPQYFADFQVLFAKFGTFGAFLLWLFSFFYAGFFLLRITSDTRNSVYTKHELHLLYIRNCVYIFYTYTSLSACERCDTVNRHKSKTYYLNGQIIFLQNII